MPDNNIPAAQPESSAAMGEFDFAKPTAENPRIKRRSLKARPSSSLQPVTEDSEAAARELAHEAPPRPAEESKPKPEEDEAKITEPTPARPVPAFSATTPSHSPSASAASRPTPTSTTSPHGTRPATLYYSSGTRKDKEPTSPMKPTPAANPPPSSSSPAARPTAATRPASVLDYRTNVDRQAREQKSVGNLLGILVYALIGLFVVGAILAGYGAYVVHQALHDQSVTVSQLDERYAAENKDLTAKLASTLDTLTQAQAQIGRQQELILKQQEAINQLMTTTAGTSAALRREQQTRTEETASLRARVRDLEYKGPSTQKY